MASRKMSTLSFHELLIIVGNQVKILLLEVLKPFHNFSNNTVGYRFQFSFANLRDVYENISLSLHKI